MKVVLLYRHGAPEIPVERDVKSPEPASNELKVSVFAAGVNFADQVFNAVLEKAADGTIAPVLSATFPLSAKGEQGAHQYIHDRRNIGEVILVHGD